MCTFFPKSVTIVLFLLISAGLIPAPVHASAPSTYLSDIDMIKDSAQAVWQITPDSDGLEFLVVLVAEDDSALDGSIYAASSRAYPTDSFFFEDAGGSWIAAGTGEIPLSEVVANSKTGTPGSLGNVLSFSLKVVSTAVGKPIFVLGLHADCAAAYAAGRDFPTGCDLSHIIRQSAFGGATEDDPAKTVKDTLLFPYNDNMNPWFADNKTAYPLRARVTENGKAQSGKEVLFAIIDGEGASLSAAKAVTDQYGVAEIKITASVPGSYVIEVVLEGDAGAQKDSAVHFLAYRPKLVFVVDSPYYTVDGDSQSAQAPAYLQDGRVFLSVRDMGQAIQALLNWDPHTQSATLMTDDAVVRVTVGADVIHVNQSGDSVEVVIDAPAVNKNGRVYLPFRAVLEAFGYQVYYDENTREITCM